MSATKPSDSSARMLGVGAFCLALMTAIGYASAQKTSAANSQTLRTSKGNAAKYVGRPAGKAVARYTVLDLGISTESLEDLPLGLNDAGTVAGWRAASNHINKAAVWENGRSIDLRKVDLDVPPTYTETYAAAVNSRRQIVGLVKGMDGANHACYWSFVSSVGAPNSAASSMRALGTLGGKVSVARGLNESGRVVGDASLPDGSIHACLWQGNAVPRDLGTLGQGDFSTAHGINKTGQVVGAANIVPNGKNHAFLFRDIISKGVSAGASSKNSASKVRTPQSYRGVMQDLGLLPGGSSSNARAINDRGQIVGWAGDSEDETHACLWENGKIRDLGTFGSDPYAAWSINNFGQIVGTASTTHQRMHACLWENGRSIDLNDLIPVGSGWLLQSAYTINERGQIVGIGQFEGAKHIFLLTPITNTPGQKTGQPIVPKPAPKTEIKAESLSIAAPITLLDVAGKRCALAEFRGRPVALFFFCGCERCVACAKSWAQIQRGDVLPQDAKNSVKTPITLIVFTGNADAARLFAAQTGLDMHQTVLLPDEKMQAARSYRAMTCPRIFVVDSAGKIRYTNDHADDAPLKASAALIVSSTLDALKRCAAGK